MGRKRRTMKPLVVDSYAQESSEDAGMVNTASSEQETAEFDAQLTKREIIAVNATPQRSEGKKIPAAAYVRLSSENGSRGDEGTLKTQIDLVHDYIYQREDLELYDTFIDNGISGTGTFADRPGFAQMMEAVRRGRVRCIVVKDLSRFGRDYLEAATYIEHIFPLLGVRLIAVNDNFDSTRPEDVNGLAFPVKNLINTMYAKDIGKKVKSHFDTQEKEEKWFGTRAPYGYLKEGRSGNWTMVPDPETAGYVRIIFHWYLSGVGFMEIANRLNLTGVPTPDQNRELLDNTRRKKVSDKWCKNGVQHILENHTYAGDIANRRHTEDGGKLKPREDWHVVQNTHEPLITHEDFNKTWEMLMNRTQKKHEKKEEAPPDDPAIFSGKLSCGICGRNFQCLSRRYADGKQARFYRCSDKNCVNSRCSVHEDVFKILIMDQIRILVRTTCDYRKLAKDLISDDPCKGKVGSIRVKITNEKAKLRQIEERILKAYEDYAEGAIEREDYIVLKDRLGVEKKETEDAISILEEKESELKEKAGKYLKITEDFEEFLDSEGYPHELIDSLVEKIEYSSDGKLSLTLKCADVYEDMVAFLATEKNGTEKFGIISPAEQFTAHLIE